MVADVSSDPITDLDDAELEPHERLPKGKRYKYPAMAKLIAVQRQMEVDALNQDEKAKDRSAAARVWAELEKLRMVKLGKPIQIATDRVQMRIAKPRKFGLLKPVVDVTPEPAAEPVNCPVPVPSPADSSDTPMNTP